MDSILKSLHAFVDAPGAALSFEDANPSVLAQMHVFCSLLLLRFPSCPSIVVLTLLKDQLGRAGANRRACR